MTETRPQATDQDLRIIAIEVTGGDVEKAQTAYAFLTATAADVTPAKPRAKRKTAKEKAAEAKAEQLAQEQAAEAAALAKADISSDDANPFADDATPTEGGTVVTQANVRDAAGATMKAGVQRPAIVKAINDAGATKIEDLTPEQCATCLTALTALKVEAEGGAGDL